MLADKELNALIKEELITRVVPQLAELGFKPFGRTNRGKLPFHYWRDLGHRIDMLDFQWDKYNRPSFVINFRPVEDERDIVRLRAEPKKYWDQLYTGYFRAGGDFKGWFTVEGLGRRFWLERTIQKLVQNVRLRIVDIDRFLNGGPPGQYIRSTGQLLKPEATPDDYFRLPSRISEE
jgi:hypothetical protein